MSPAKDHNFNGIPDNTLGFLNESFRSPTPDPTNQLRNTLGPAVYDRLVPMQPFPWLDFANRPYANPGELMQVPAWRPSQLLPTFSFMNPTGTNNAVPKQELYVDTTNGAAVFEVKPSDKFKWLIDGPYGHLLNFFRVKPRDPGRNPQPGYRGPASCARLRDGTRLVCRHRNVAQPAGVWQHSHGRGKFRRSALRLPTAVQSGFGTPRTGSGEYQHDCQRQRVARHLSWQRETRWS